MCSPPGTRAPGGSSRSIAMSSPSVSAAVRRNVIRSPLAGFSNICPAYAMVAPSVDSSPPPGGGGERLSSGLLGRLGVRHELVGFRGGRLLEAPAARDEERERCADGNHRRSGPERWDESVDERLGGLVPARAGEDRGQHGN